MKDELKLEVCCGDMLSVRAAIEGGADRIELCEALEVDGLTPSAEMMESAISLGTPVQVLIRPREGDFVYDEDEVEGMVRDIRLAKRLGANGVVIGALKPDGSIDEGIVRRLVEEAKGLSITFHRAFDVCREPMKALEQIVALGCHRLLTSGQASSAEQGIPLIKKLVEQSDGRLIIMPGAGVNQENARRILSETGAHEIHGSLRKDGHTDAELVRATRNSLTTDGA
ncbi:MAG: copper homeostasis protein CutC [Bacteroidaceae bacterium]|nr:copper homeostasis protein CutC [Bacteroidaceae bacterium]